MCVYIDVDGTLVSSMERHYLLFCDILCTYNVDITIDDKSFAESKRMGLSTQRICVELLGLGPLLAENISKEWVENIEKEEYLKYDTIYLDADEFVRKISLKHKVILLTARNNKTGFQRFIEKASFYSKISEIIVVPPVDAVRGKVQAVEYRGDKNAVLIGDTETEYKAGKSLGISTYLLNRGFRSREFWEKHNVISYEGLEDIYNKMCQDGMNLKG